MSLKSATNTDVNKHELILEIDADKFENAIENVYKQEKANITVPGFRKGKASRKMVENHYGEGVFYEKAINSLVNDEMMNALEETKLILVTQPSIEVVSIDRKEGVVLKATCITKPEVTVTDYKGIRAPKIVKDVTEEEINARLETLRTKNARLISIDDRPTQLKDEVTIDFEGFLDGVPFEGGKGTDFPLRLGSGQFIPGFEDQVVGHSVGEEFEINVTFPEDYAMQELAGKETVFKIKLKEITMQELPELDDELVRDSTEFETVEALKKDIKEKLEKNAENTANVEFENKIFDEIIDSVDAEIPECMFENRINTLVNEFKQSLKAQGMTMELYLQYTGMDEEAFRDTFADRAEKEVILRLALEKIAINENLTVSDEELQEGLEKLAAENKLDVETLKKYISVEGYKLDLLVSKAAEFVKEHAIVDNTIAETESKEDTEEEKTEE